MGKKVGKKETLGLILSEVVKLRGEVKSLEKQQAALLAHVKPARKKAAKRSKASKPAASASVAAKKSTAAARRPVLVEGALIAPARSAG